MGSTLLTILLDSPKLSGLRCGRDLIQKHFKMFAHYQLYLKYTFLDIMRHLMVSFSS